MAGISLDRVCKHYGEVRAVEGVSLDVADGEMVALLGPSGCGKTTTLRMVAGFVKPTAGTLRFGSRDVTAVPVHKRNVGMVFQGHALFPHLTVAQNVAFGLRQKSWDKPRRAERVTRMLQWVQLAGLANRYPRALSGGQRQRVALARAMAIEPEVLLLDEPFSALDAKLRTQMRSEIRALQKEAAITSVFVTHDQDEAMGIADRIGVMNNGRLEQLGKAEDIYERPASRFVASFIGHCNFIDGRVVRPGTFESREGRVFGFNDTTTLAQGAATLCFRPENAMLGTQPGECQNSIGVVIDSISYLGPSIRIETHTYSGHKIAVSLPSSAAATLGSVGDLAWVTWRRDKTFLLR